MDKHICSRCNKALASRESLRRHERRKFPCKAATSTVAVNTEKEIGFNAQNVAVDVKTEIGFNAHQEAVQSSFDSCKKKLLSMIGRCFVHYRKDSMVVTILCDLITLVEDIYLNEGGRCLSNETVQDIITNMLKQMRISKLMQMELQIAVNNLLYLRGSVKL